MVCSKKQRISMDNLLWKSTIVVPCFLQPRCSDHPLDAMVHLSHTGAFSVLHSYRYLLIFQSKVASSLCSTVMTSCMIFSVLNKVCIKLFSKIFSFEVNNGNKYLNIYSWILFDSRNRICEMLNFTVNLYWRLNLL